MFTVNAAALAALNSGVFNEAERLSIPAGGGESCCWVEADFNSDRSSRATVCAISWMASFEVLCPLESSVEFCFSAIAQKASCRVCCHRIQLQSFSLSLSFTPNLQSGSSPSRSFLRLRLSLLKYTSAWT